MNAPLKIAFVGDISLGEHYFSFGHGPRSLIERGENIFASTPDLLGCELVVGNLEGPISDAGYNPESPHSRVFRGSPKSAAQLKAAGINVLSVANNHSIQHGQEAFNETVEILKQQSIQVIGLAESPEIFVTCKGIKLCILGCSLIPDNTDQQQSLYYAPNTHDLVDRCKKLKSQCDKLIISIHWGKEGKLTPEATQIALADELVKAGVDVIAGHHTHSLQPIIKQSNHLIAYSLGNFVFDLGWSKKNTESLVLYINLDAGNSYEAYWQKVHIAQSGQPATTGTPIRIDSGETTLTALQKDEKHEPIAKLFYFLKHLPHGDTRVKLRFLAWKIQKKFV